MNNVLKNFKTTTYMRNGLCAILSLCLVAAIWSQDDHAGHDHSEEAGHGAFHEEHATHDDHVHTEKNERDHVDHGDAEARHDHAGHDDHAEHGVNEKGIVSIPESVQREFGITLSVAGPGVLHEEVILPGEIEFNRERLAYVNPRYDGTVTAIEVRLADQVRKGQILALLESTETLRPFDVKAPFDGTIVSYDISPGESVEAGTPLFTVADLSSVWADLRIYQRDLNKVRRGQRVVIVNGHDGPQFTGTITYIAPTIDEHTRTGLARAIVDNAGGQWRPGQFVKGNVSIEEHEAEIVIPRSALLSHEGEPVVFVQTDEGFELRPVRLGHSDAVSVELESGLEVGETYVTQNAISLKAELNKGSFGGHAGHVH